MSDPGTRIIRTPDQRLRVFVSSTLQEVADERKAAREAITKLRLSPVMFELGARPHPPKDLYRAYLDQSHIFIGIYWQKYGWVAPDMDISGLEDEYNLSGDKPKLIYIKSPAPDREPRLKQMLDRIKNDNVSYKYFATAEELRESIENDLAMLLTERFETTRTSDSGPIESAVPRRSNLPMPPTSLIGREAELAAIHDLFRHDTVRLLTLTGTGGTGKTRLAVQAALDLLDQFKDGVFFVNLAPISDPSLVASTIATALDVRETVGSRPLIDTLKDYLRHKQLLLLLDNFEQVVSSAPVVTELLETCPRLKILVTSRTPLHVRGEKEQPVPTLALPDRKSLPDVERLRQYAAVELFIQRVLDVKPDFTITPESLLAIAEICTRLDGLPLAIELAAARIKILSPQMMLARLEHRLPLLTEGARDLPARQQTLRSAIDWSYNLLDESARTLFRRLSVFVGGWTLEAAEAVCKSDDDPGIDVLDGLESLVDNSLLTQIEEPSGEPRFRMLETIREYALERLAASPREGEEMRQRHAEYYLALAEVAEDKLRSAERVAWLDRLEGEHDNLRAALEWSTVKNDRTEIGLGIAGALLWFWHTRGYATEGRGWLKRLLTLNGVASGTTARAKALYGAGELAWAQGDYPAARPLLEKGLVVGRAAGDRRSVAYALAFLGMVVITQGDVATARSLYQESIALLREVGDKWGEAFTLNWTADALLAGGDLPTARSFYEQSLTLWRATGDPWGSSLPLMALGGIALSQADYAAAQACFEESVALSRSIGDRWGLSWVLSGLGNLALRRGDLGRAKAIFEESLTLGRDMGNPIGIIVCFGGIARLAAAQGDTVRAARLIGAAEALRESLNAYPWHATRLAYEQNVADARAQLDEEAFAAAYTEGRSMTREQAFTYALEVSSDE